MTLLAAVASHLLGAAVTLGITRKVCPKAPPRAQKYADDEMGYVL